MHVKADSLHTSEIPLMCIFSLDISCNCVALPVKENQCENQNWVWIRQRFRMQKYDCKLLFTLSAWKTLNIRSSSTRFPNHLVDSSDPDLPGFSVLAFRDRCADYETRDSLAAQFGGWNNWNPWSSGAEHCSVNRRKNSCSIKWANLVTAMDA